MLLGTQLAGWETLRRASPCTECSDALRTRGIQMPEVAKVGTDMDARVRTRGVGGTQRTQGAYARARVSHLSALLIADRLPSSRLAQSTIEIVDRLELAFFLGHVLE